jgi:hypothetical protein
MTIFVVMSFMNKNNLYNDCNYFVKKTKISFFFYIPDINNNKSDSELCKSGSFSGLLP